MFVYPKTLISYAAHTYFSLHALVCVSGIFPLNNFGPNIHHPWNPLEQLDIFIGGTVNMVSQAKYFKFFIRWLYQ
jgi:hypothetical protein